MGLPDVTVVTPTTRPDLLRDRCIPSVQMQDYDGRIRHLIVGGSPVGNPSPLPGRPLRFECDPGQKVDGYGGGIARRHGASLADTPYVAYLDDDNAFYPEHIRTLVEAIEETGVDFVYSRQRRLSPDGQQVRWVAGDAPPRLGGIDTSLILHRRELLEKATWPDGPTPPEDALLATTWVRMGATWHHVPVITQDYYER